MMKIPMSNGIKRVGRFNIIITFLAIFLLAACSKQSTSTPESKERKTTPHDFQQEIEAQPTPSAALLKRSAGPESIPTKILPHGISADEIPEDKTIEKIDWGRESTLDKIVEMAKNGQIYEIQWHVMPNIIRTLASDGRIFHIRNENKGVDIRNVLKNAGVPLRPSLGRSET